MAKRLHSSDAQRLHAKNVLSSLVLVAVMFYLAFHAVSGERGVFALFKESRKLEDLRAELGRVKAKREGLERKTRLLSDESLDLDLLDEQVRRVLGQANKGEVVYFLDEPASVVP